MKHAIAHTLDICMLKLFEFLQQKSSQALSTTDIERQQKLGDSLKFLKLLIKAFDDVILPIHNTHHVQFVIFYFCSLKVGIPTIIVFFNCFLIFIIIIINLN